MRRRQREAGSQTLIRRYIDVVTEQSRHNGERALSGVKERVRDRSESMGTLEDMWKRRREEGE